MSEKMVYVAVDPSQPTAAYAICVGDISDKMTKDSILEWLEEGASVLRVTMDEGLKMIDLWVDMGGANAN